MADGTLKVGTITNSQGSGNITIGSGVTLLSNVPAFGAYLSANQTVTDNATTKAQINTEVFDTNGCYDNTTNYRFTPTVAGKYFVYFAICCEADANVINDISVYLYKNGVEYLEVRDNPVASERGIDVGGSNIVDFNGTTDYVEVYGRINVDSNTPSFKSSTKSTYFGAYRIGA
tara:strand:+ start:130 stop:651 length:522 start_codon:yes stop_codon:yes gene_type:complete